MVRVERPSWLGPDPAEVAEQQLAGSWALMQQQQKEAAAEERKRLAQMWAGIGVGDGVQLSRKESGEILQVRDSEGMQVELDGVVLGIEGEWATVRVMLMTGKGDMPVMSVSATVRGDELKRVEGVHVWSRLGAKRVAKERKGEVYGESPYWGEM